MGTPFLTGAIAMDVDAFVDLRHHRARRTRKAQRLRTGTPMHFSQQHVFAVLAILVALGMTSGFPSTEAQADQPPSPERIQQIVAVLSPKPQGVGPTIDDRDTWSQMATRPESREFLERAEELRSQPVPELSDELYLQFTQSGNRSIYQGVLFDRHRRVTQLVLAECLENGGRFIPAIEEAIRAICAEKTWVLPAHDGSLQNFRGEVTEIDLTVATFSWELATADYWLGHRLNSEVRQLLRSELERRTFEPFEGAVERGKPRLSWLTTTNNWNAVCLAGVTGSALAMIETPERRAYFVAAAEQLIQNFLRGFTPDGYCSEGISYWNYGFGHFLLLAETVRQATGGQVDLMADPRIKPIASFGHRMEMSPDVYPAFADCPLGAQPDRRWLGYVSRRLEMGWVEDERRGLSLASQPSSSLVLLGTMGSAAAADELEAPSREVSRDPALRDWFPDAGILICRPAKESPCQLAVALKGGHNAEHHNHNDVGSYVVALNRSTPLLDPGSEVYTARTFNSQRYESGVLNSFGHPVPRVAGALQQVGRNAAAEIVETSWTDASDTLTLDLTPAYSVPDLRRLRRVFEYSRLGRGSLTVSDHVEFASPQAFETAFITMSPWKQLGPRQIVVGQAPDAVIVEIDPGDQAIQLRAEEIKEDLPGKGVPVRLGIELTEPVREARITLTITAAEEG